MTKRIVIISGGMGGIGRAIALQLAENFELAILDISIDQEFINSLPGSGHAGYQCDILRATEVQSRIASLPTDRIYACIHAAVSPLVRKKASLIEENEFRQQFEVTTFGALNLFQAAIPHLKKNNKGKIIGITSAALEPNAENGSMAGYICAKFALHGLLRELSKELISYGITTNAVAPDFVRTALHNDLPERAFELIKDKNKGKELRTQDIAVVLSDLLSDESTAANGIVKLVKISGTEDSTL